MPAVLLPVLLWKAVFVLSSITHSALTLLIVSQCSIAFADEVRWWPEQTLPKSLVRTREHGDPATKMLVQSVAGLAAKAVNQGQGEELVWVFNDNYDMELWYQAFLNKSVRDNRQSNGRFISDSGIPVFSL